MSCPLIIFVVVIILLRFAHVIFIEINVDKIINAFTKIIFVNVVNVYHIYGNNQCHRQSKRQTNRQMVSQTNKDTNRHTLLLTSSSINQPIALNTNGNSKSNITALPLREFTRFI